MKCFSALLLLPLACSSALNGANGQQDQEPQQALNSPGQVRPDPRPDVHEAIGTNQAKDLRASGSEGFEEPAKFGGRRPIRGRRRHRKHRRRNKNQQGSSGSNQVPKGDVNEAYDYEGYDRDGGGYSAPASSGGGGYEAPSYQAPSSSGYEAPSSTYSATSSGYGPPSYGAPSYGSTSEGEYDFTDFINSLVKFLPVALFLAALPPNLIYVGRKKRQAPDPGEDQLLGSFLWEKFPERLELGRKNVDNDQLRRWWWWLPSHEGSNDINNDQCLQRYLCNILLGQPPQLDTDDDQGQGASKHDHLRNPMVHKMLASMAPGTGLESPNREQGDFEETNPKSPDPTLEAAKSIRCEDVFACPSQTS